MRTFALLISVLAFVGCGQAGKPVSSSPITQSGSAQVSQDCQAFSGRFSIQNADLGSNNDLNAGTIPSSLGVSPTGTLQLNQYMSGTASLEIDETETSGHIKLGFQNVGSLVNVNVTLENNGLSQQSYCRVTNMGISGHIYTTGGYSFAGTIYFYLDGATDPSYQVTFQ